jgi:prephenate dehydrogenase
MKTKELDTIAILGLGLLGGSLGLAVNRAFAHVKRVGYSHRAVTRKKALGAGAVDVICKDAAQAVRDAQLVVLASPIGTFEELMREIAGSLREDGIVTDVGSTKVLPVRWAREILGSKVQYLGSHPMAGSEQRGMDFARADLFENAQCILTPTAQTKQVTLEFMTDFWTSLGMRVCTRNPAEHDRVLARISHLPHVLASALVNCSDAEQILLCGKGFLDTTRIASGPPGMWRDILMANADHTASAIGRAIKELTRLQKALQKGDEKAIMKMLSDAQLKRNELVEKKIKRKEMPA